MAYGSPRNIEEVEPYYTDIRGGRKPSQEQLDELKARYEAIGGPSLLNDITRRQAEALSAELEARRPGEYRVVVGMKHWHPFIADSVAGIGAGFDRVVGLVLAPHFSKKSIGEYESRIIAARDQHSLGFDLTMVRQWYDEPEFVELVAENLRATLEEWDGNDFQTGIFFTAHSIPARIVEQGDPYADQLEHSARLFSRAAGIGRFEVGWQSASATGEPWLGPDILTLLEEHALHGGRRALVAPVGFVSDHLEILYDVDVECVEAARRLHLELRRIPSPNDDPRFIEALANVVERAVGGPGGAADGIN